MRTRGILQRAEQEIVQVYAIENADEECSDQDLCGERCDNRRAESAGLMQADAAETQKIVGTPACAEAARNSSRYPNPFSVLDRGLGRFPLNYFIVDDRVERERELRAHLVPLRKTRMYYRMYALLKRKCR